MYSTGVEGSLIPQITPQDAAATLASEPLAVLLDVREPDEWETTRLESALFISMHEVPTQLARIPKDATVLVLCRSGKRSQTIAEFLKGEGYADVRNVAGGINRWAREVDPRLTEY